MPRDGFSARVAEQALQRAEGKCETCGGMLKNRYEVDHIKPRALGGTNDLLNAMVLCMPCHLRKTLESDMPEIRKADRKGKATRTLEVASGSPALMRMGWVPAGDREAGK